MQSKKIIVRGTVHTSNQFMVDTGIKLVKYLAESFEGRNAQNGLRMSEIIDLAVEQMVSVVPTDSSIGKRSEHLGILYFALAAALKLPLLVHQMWQQGEQAVDWEFPLELAEEIRGQADRHALSQVEYNLYMLWHYLFDRICYDFDEEIERGGSNQVLIHGDWAHDTMQVLIGKEQVFLKNGWFTAQPGESISSIQARTQRWIETLSMRGQAFLVLQQGLEDGRIKL